MTLPTTLESPTAEDRAELDRAMGGVRRVLRRVSRFFNDVTYRWIATSVAADLFDASLVTSKVEGTEMHAPVLDLDIPHALVASSTPGHGHLYLNVPMTWEQYKKLLAALAEAGVVSDEFARVSVEQGFSSVRVPGLRK